MRDQEALPVRRNRIGMIWARQAARSSAVRHVHIWRIEQFLRCARYFERGTTRVDIDRHYLSTGLPAHVEQLASIAAPARKLASVRRDLPLARSARERLHVHLNATGFIRVVCDPMPVGRDLPVAFAE